MVLELVIVPPIMEAEARLKLLTADATMVLELVTVVPLIDTSASVEKVARRDERLDGSKIRQTAGDDEVGD